MSRKLPKATAHTLDDIKRGSEPAHAEHQPEPVPAADNTAALQRSRAETIIERHTTYGAIGGVIPLPIIDMLSVTAVVVSMVDKLAKLYGVPFRRDKTRAVVAGLIAGVGQASAGAATTAALFKTVPGAQLVGCAMASIASAVLVRALGRAFILHFETGGTALVFDPARLRAYFDQERARR